MDHTDRLALLVGVASSRTCPAGEVDATRLHHAGGEGGTRMYANRLERLNIEFSVERLAFPGIQTLDPRIVRIPAGRNNERHRHAHESLFVVLSGRGVVHIGDAELPVAAGDVAFVPRWVFHQTVNPGDGELVLLAVTDFGFTSAVLGDYDKRMRLAEGEGEEVAS